MTRACRTYSSTRENLPHQAEPIAVDSGGSDSDQHVTHLYLCSVYKFALLDDSGCVAGYVIFPILIHAGHFGSLSANKGTAGLAAAFGDSGDYCLNHFRTGLALGDIVKEYKRFSSLCKDVIDAHGNSVDADGVVLVHRKGYLEFRSDTVGSAHENRLLDVKGAEIEHPAKSTYIAHYPKPRSRSYMFLDPPDDIVTGFQADARFLVVYCHCWSCFIFLQI